MPHRPVWDEKLSVAPAAAPTAPAEVPAEGTQTTDVQQQTTRAAQKAVDQAGERVEGVQTATVDTTADTASTQSSEAGDQKPKQELEEAAASALDTVEQAGALSGFDKFLETLTQLLDKIVAKFESLFKSKTPETPKFSKSPVEKDKVNILRKYEKGKGIEFAAEAGKPIYAVEGGKISVRGNIVTLTLAKGHKIVYTNVTPAAGLEGKEIKAGEKIGVVEANKNTVQFQVLRAQTKGDKVEFTEIDPTNYLIYETAPQSGGPAVAQGSAETPGQAPAGGTKAEAGPKAAPSPAADQSKAAPDKAETAGAGIEQQRVTAINEALKDYLNKTTTTSSFEFTFPMTKDSNTEAVKCTINGNNFEIGGAKYQIGSELIAIEATPSADASKIADGKFIFKNNLEISINDLVTIFEELHNGRPPEQIATIGGQQIQLTKLA